MRKPSRKQERLGHHGGLNAVVYALVVLAVLLVAVAAWKRYSPRRRLAPVGVVAQGGDISRPAYGVAGGRARTGGPARGAFASPRYSFACPQCRSFCRTHARGGSPACPFCGRAMVSLGSGFSPAGGTTAGGVAAPLAIRVGTVRPHGARGPCANCHTVSRPGVGVPPAELTPVAAVRRRPATARPVLIRKLGVEIDPASGAGARVTGVMGNSYAWNAGLRAGDIIIGFNGSTVSGVGQFQRLVARATPEADAPVRILRNGRTRDLLVMVGEGEMDGFTPIRRP